MAAETDAVLRVVRNFADEERRRVKLTDLLGALHEDVTLSSAEEIHEACRIIVLVQEMTAAERDTLRALHDNGPLYDGDIPSKSGRDSLEDDGLSARVVSKGEEGFNACTYRGAQAYRILSLYHA